MAKPREVKPWTIYPATQEDRDIIERKAAEAGLSVSSYLCLVGKLANITVDFPLVKQILSVQVTTPKIAESEYTLHNSWGKLLTDKEAAAVEKEIAKGKITLVSEAEDGTGWKQYVCKINGVDFDFIQRPVKEV